MRGKGWVIQDGDGMTCCELYSASKTRTTATDQHGKTVLQEKRDIRRTAQSCKAAAAA